MRASCCLPASLLAASLSLLSCTAAPEPLVSTARADDLDAARSAVRRGCTAETTRGTYVVACRGSVSLDGTSFVPMTMLGTAHADARGEFTGRTTVMVAGSELVQVVTGTEKIEPDCTGAITYAVQVVTPGGLFTPPPPQDKLDIQFVVSRHGDRIEGMVVDPGTAVQCELRRQEVP